MNGIVVGRIVLFLIVVGIAVGAYRMYANHGSLGLPAIHMPGSGGSSSGGSGDITLLTTASKAGWLQDEVSAFNTQNQGKYHITLAFDESRQAMQDIIAGKQKPTIWSPSSPIWIDRLSEYTKQRDGTAIIDPDDMNSCRTFLRTPLVILTTREKQAYLERIFKSQQPWTQMHQIGLGRQRPPWGRLTYSHSDPLVSNSGMLTLGLMLNEYNQAHGQESIENTAKDPAFIGWTSDIEHSLVYDEPAKKGSQPLVDSYAGSTGSRDFVTAYESAALGAANSNPDLVVIYPNPTIVAEQMVGILSASWVSDDQKQGAQLFLQMLSTQDSLQRGIQYNMRPASTQTSVSLLPTLSQHSGQGFQQSYTAIEMPPYAALNDAAYQWRIHVAHQPVQ